jgi:hypothetical protein
MRIAAAVAVLLVAANAGAEPACGAPGKPACPLQDWMRRNLALALAKKDGPALVKHFEEIGRRNPSKGQWANWNKFAKDGADAARAGRFSGVITTCGRCHSVYRAEYIIRYR